MKITHSKKVFQSLPVATPVWFQTEIVEEAPRKGDWEKRQFICSINFLCQVNLLQVRGEGKYTKLEGIFD